MKKVVAWAYMVELESGLSKKQTAKLLELVPEETEVVPFTLDGPDSLLEANSTAIGFIDNDYYEEFDEIKATLAEVCNDWNKESSDLTYDISADSTAFMVS